MKVANLSHPCPNWHPFAIWLKLLLPGSRVCFPTPLNLSWHGDFIWPIQSMAGTLYLFWFQKSTSFVLSGYHVVNHLGLTCGEWESMGRQPSLLRPSYVGQLTGSCWGAGEWVSPAKTGSTVQAGLAQTPDVHSCNLNECLFQATTFWNGLLCRKSGWRCS